MPNNRLNLRTHAVVMHGAATTSFLESTLSERSLYLITHVYGQNNHTHGERASPRIASCATM